MHPISQIKANPIAPDSEKDSLDYGLKVMRGCYNRWKNGYGGETYVNRISRISKNRLYAMGKQPEEQYVDWEDFGGLPQILNIDYSALAVAVPMLNAKIDRYMQREEKIKCKSFGPLSQNRKKKDKDEAKYKMNYGEAIKDLQKSSGLQLEQFSDDDPKSEQELNIKFKTTYKTKEELIMQMGLNMVFEQNEWAEVIKPMLLMDVFCAGYSVVQTELDGNGWIKTPRIRPEDFITSYSEYPDFRDWQWQGPRRSMAITEVRQRWPGVVSEEKLWELANSVKGRYGNPVDWYCEWDDYYYTVAARPYDAINVEVLDLYYKTLYNLKYEKVTNSYGRDVYKPITNKSKNIEQSKPYYVAYHGVWIIDTEIVLEWGLAKNMLKPNSNLVEIRSPFAVYMWGNNKCRNTPLVETMIPMIDMLQNIHSQVQRIIATTAPDGFNIDLLGLSNIDMGNGVGVISPMQAWGIYLQTGNQYYRSKEPDSDEPSQPPIQPQNNQYSNKLEQLDQQWWSIYKKLQIITGDNNLASGNITNQGVAGKAIDAATEIAESPSNYAYHSYLMNYKDTAKNAELLLLDKFFLKDDSFDGYLKALGEEDIKYMRENAAEGMEMLMFDTTIKVVNDDADKARWNKFIEIALSQNQITPADVAVLDMIEDQTYRAFMFDQAVKENRAAQQQVAMQNSQANIAQAKAAADAKGQHDMMLEQEQAKNKQQLQQDEYAAKLSMKNLEGVNMMEGKIVDAVLSDPEATIDKIPGFIWERLHITDTAMKQFVLNAMQKAAQQKQQQAIQQAQMAQQQAQNPQQAA